jgi:hypothetical protein
MKNITDPHILLPIFIILFTLPGCTKKIERSGIVIDSQTNEPLKNVEIEIYLDHLKGDSLFPKVLTDSNGYFQIMEKRSKKRSFVLQKNGYIGYVGTLSIMDDTIKLEKTGD